MLQNQAQPYLSATSIVHWRGHNERGARKALESPNFLRASIRTVSHTPGSLQGSTACLRFGLTGSWRQQGWMGWSRSQQRQPLLGLLGLHSKWVYEIPAAQSQEMSTDILHSSGDLLLVQPGLLTSHCSNPDSPAALR